MRESEKIVRERFCQNDESIDLSEMNITLETAIFLMDEFASIKVNELFKVVGEFCESLNSNQ